LAAPSTRRRTPPSRRRSTLAACASAPKSRTLRPCSSCKIWLPAALWSTSAAAAEICCCRSRTCSLCCTSLASISSPGRLRSSNSARPRPSWQTWGLTAVPSRTTEHRLTLPSLCMPVALPATPSSPPPSTRGRAS